MGIDDSGGSGRVDDVCNTRVEKVERGHQTSHVNRGARVSNTVSYRNSQLIRCARKRFLGANCLD